MRLFRQLFHTHLLKMSIILLGIVSPFLILVSPLNAESLIPGNSYAVILERIGPDGEGTVISTDIVTANANGAVEFAFTNVPNCSSKDNPVTNPTRFLIISIISEDELDSFQPHNSGGFVIATEKSTSLFTSPAIGKTISLGANNLTSIQSKGILRSFKVTGTDDPLLALIGMVVYRSEEMSKDDIQKIALSLADQVFYPGEGFYDKLKEVSVTDDQIAQFKSAIVCEEFGEGEASFKSYMAKTASANQLVVESGSGQADLAKQRHLQAGEELGGILINAAAVVEPEITLQQLLHAVESIEFESTDEYEIDSSLQTLVSNSLNSFFSRIRTEGQAQQWEAAMQALSASGAQITQFKSAIDTYLEATVAARSDAYNDSVYDQIEYNYLLDIQATSDDIEVLVEKVANYIGYYDTSSHFYQNNKMYGYYDDNSVWIEHPEPIIPESPMDHEFFEQFILNRVTWFDFYYTQENGNWKFNRHLIPRTSIVQLLAFNFIADYLVNGNTHSYSWVSTPWPWDYSDSYTDSEGNYVQVTKPDPEAFTDCEDDYNYQRTYGNSFDWAPEPGTSWFLSYQFFVMQDIQYALDNLAKWRSVAYLPELKQHEAVSYATKCYPLFLDLIKESWDIDIPDETKDHIINLLLGPQSDEVDQNTSANAQSSGPE